LVQKRIMWSKVEKSIQEHLSDLLVGKLQRSKTLVQKKNRLEEKILNCISGKILPHDQSRYLFLSSTEVNNRHGKENDRPLRRSTKHGSLRHSQPMVINAPPQPAEKCDDSMTVVSKC